MSEFKKQYLPVAVSTAQKYGLDPVMFAAQIEQESGWNPNAKSKAGARGIAQFMPATAKEMGLTNPLDPVSAIDAAARYMAKLRDELGSEDLARQAYNGGIGTVKKVVAGKGKLPAETAQYNPAIEQRAQKLAKELGMQPGAMQASADQGVAAPALAAGESGRGRVKVSDAAAQALQEMNAGLPAGALSPQPEQIAQSVAPNWQQALAQLGAPAQPAASAAEAPNFDMLAELQDAASKNQDRVLAGMFGDMQGPQQEDTSILPASIDRYLDRLLS